MSPNDADIVCTDNWLTLRSDNKLLVHHYYLPNPTRTLDLHRIKSVTPVTLLDLSIWEYKVWGVGPTFICWPMDWSRLSNSNQYVREHSLLIRTSEGFWKKLGVSCEDPERFLAAIEGMGVKVIRDASEVDGH
jgi:hypothetical protein